MPNVAALLKEEITRLSRKEVRRQLAGMKKASAQYRHHIAALRRQISNLLRQVSVLQTRSAQSRIRGTGGDGSDADAIRAQRSPLPPGPSRPLRRRIRPAGRA